MTEAIVLFVVAVFLPSCGGLIAGFILGNVYRRTGRKDG